MSISDYDTEELWEMLNDGVVATDCPEGCEVEPDGNCPHGFKSIFLDAGMI